MKYVSTINALLKERTNKFTIQQLTPLTVYIVITWIIHLHHKFRNNGCNLPVHVGGMLRNKILENSQAPVDSPTQDQ